MKKKFTAVLFIILSLMISGCSSAKSTGAASEEFLPEATNDRIMAVMPESANMESADAQESTSTDTADTNGSAQLAAGTMKSGNSARTSISAELDVAVGNAVLDYNKDFYVDEELYAEGHIVLDEVAESDSSVTVYAITMFGGYGFQNNAFIKVAGTGAIPTVINFNYSKENGYYVRTYTVPNDGSGYAASVKEMFPKDLYNRVISTSDNDYANLQAQERKYAKAYLNKMGRSATIGEYKDIEHKSLNISAQASNEIFKRYWEYPSWIGTQEKIEDGTRYVYETQLKNYGNEDSMVYFTKYVYDTGEIIKSVNVFIEDGEIHSSEEKVTRIIENSVK